MSADTKSFWPVINGTMLVSGAYLFVFVMTFGLLGWLDPTHQHYANYTSLIFLPHGIRVLAAWLFRWRAVIYLAPGALAGHLYLYGATMTPALGIGFVAGLVCAPLAFFVLERIGLVFRPGAGTRTHWRDIALAGAVASIFNSAATSIAYDNSYVTMSARFVGDIVGTLICIAILMVLLRLRDRIRWG